MNPKIGELKKTKQTKEELIQIHVELHQSLDKLLACWLLGGTERYPSRASLMEFLQWSNDQTKEPECLGDK